jgi:hypothetical protein
MKLSQTLSQKFSLQLSTALALEKGLDQLHERVKYFEGRLTNKEFLKEMQGFFLKAGKKTQFSNHINTEQLLSHSPHLLLQSLEYAAERHKEEFRDSGMPYLSHTLSAGFILARLGFPKEVVWAGILHDTVEDTADKNRIMNDIHYIMPQTAFYVYSVSGPDIRDSVEKDNVLYSHIQTYSSLAGNLYPQAIKCADGIANIFDLNYMDGKDGRTARQRKELFLNKAESVLLPYARLIDSQKLIPIRRKNEQFLLEEYLADLIAEKKQEL